MRISEQRNGGERPEAGTAAPIPIVRKTTGPRTELGKRSASRNAMKHGVFSKVVVLESESKAEFGKLLEELWEDRHPVGKCEELLVEKLACIIWRQRRLFSAERAEVQKSTESLKWNCLEHVWGKSLEGEITCGLIEKVSMREVNQRCQLLLLALQVQISLQGFDEKGDRRFLEMIYGGPNSNCVRVNLYDYYSVCLGLSQASEEERLQSGFAPKEAMVRQIKKEIDRLKTYQKAQACRDDQRAPLEIASRGVPDAQTLDRLLRYEASLNRDFDRTLGQLERLQRIRQGQPVAPRIEVDLKR
jgi:hypothetical protein